MGDVVLFERSPHVTIKACQSCKFLIRDGGGPSFWKCGISGRYCATENMSSDGCGPEKLLWQQRPPDPPSFWKRLGDAIIARIGEKS